MSLVKPANYVNFMCLWISIHWHVDRMNRYLSLKLVEDSSRTWNGYIKESKITDRFGLLNRNLWSMILVEDLREKVLLISFGWVLIYWNYGFFHLWVYLHLRQSIDVVELCPILTCALFIFIKPWNITKLIVVVTELSALKDVTKNSKVFCPKLQVLIRSKY